MKKIALFGATGMIGQRILAEALSRGHHVTAIVRDPSKLAAKAPNLEVRIGDVSKPESVSASVAGSDVVVSAYAPPQTDPQLILPATHSLIGGIVAANKKAAHPLRLIFVGGAGSLEVAPGMQLIDAPGFPESYRGIAVAHHDALKILRESPIDWTNFSPAAFIQPGTRTGKYRTGTDQLIVDAKGESRISAEDYAVALLDEIENPHFQGKRFTAAY